MGKYLVDKVKNVFQWARKLLPFSDAKQGPFSDLTLSGSRMMTTLASGVQQGQGTLYGAMNNAFSNAPSPTLGVNGYQGNLAGITPTGTAAPTAVTKTVTIAKLIEKIEIYGADSKDPATMAEEIIGHLYDRLKGADDILANADMGAVL
jgi:hypothetical protein